MASNDRNILGISLVDDQLRVVEGHKSGSELQISEVAHGRLRQHFNFEVFSDKSMPRRFAEDISRLFDAHDFEVKDAAFSLNSQMVLIKKMSVDSVLDKEQLTEHVTWEVRQLAISPINEYIIDYEPLTIRSEETSLAHVLVVIVRKKIVDFLRELFQHTPLRLKVIDVDIFSAQRALQLNYDYSQSGRVGLVDIAESKVNFSVLEGMNYFLSQEFKVPVNSVTERDDNAVRVISKELRRVIQDNQIGHGVEDLSEIYLYGEAVEDRILESLQNSYNVRINRANPFRRVRLLNKAKDEAEVLRSERFMVSVGAAIRGLQ